MLTAVSFAETIAFDDGINRSQAIETADLDGDGDVDAIALSAGELLTFLNNGAGGFGDPIAPDQALPGDARSLTLQDFDGDGDIDAVAGSGGNPERDHATVTLFENDGAGNLSLKLTLMNSTQDDFVDDIGSGDLDGDGDMDVIAVGRGSSQVFLLKNNGDGTFADASVITGDFLEPRAVHITDMDGDGNDDVVLTASYAASESHHVFWYKNDGDANFGDDPTALIDTGSEPRFLDSADVDGDGDADLVVPLQGAGEIVLIENTDGDGSLGLPLTLAGGLFMVERVRFGDVDGDTDLDVVSTVDGGGQVIWLENVDGNGAFSDVNFVSEDTAQASGLSIADLDNDGDVDAMTTSQFAAKVSVHNNDGTGTFTTTELTPDNAIDPQKVVLADINGDGHLDMIGQSEFDYELAWYANAGDGTFGGQNMIVDYDLPPEDFGDITIWWDIEAADMDGDGDLDIVTTEPNFVDKILWYENLDGQGDFGELHIYTGLTDDGARLIPTEITVIDFDGDGDNDIVGNHVLYDAGVGWYENTDGEGSLEARQAILIDGHSSGGLGKHVVGDIDGDGDQDILVGDNNSNVPSGVLWVENVNGVFDTAQVLKSDQALINGVRLADMDQDGDLDVVMATILNAESPTIIEWFENTDGNGTFSDTPTLVGEQILVEGLYVADVDGDGDNEVISPGAPEGLIEIFDNNGDGTFTRYQVNEEPIFDLTVDIGIADINGDGRIDIVAGKGQDNAYVAYIQTDTVNPFDLDGDGDVDSEDALLLYDSVRAGSQDAKFDLNGDGSISNLDMVDMMSIGLDSSVGDSNFDGSFGTSDLVLVFQASEYEDDLEANSTWATGDWNIDGEFTTNDLVFVFQNGKYEGVPEAAKALSQSLAASIPTEDRPLVETEELQDHHVAKIDQVAAVLDAAEVDQIFQRTHKDLIQSVDTDQEDVDDKLNAI